MRCFIYMWVNAFRLLQDLLFSTQKNHFFRFSMSIILNTFLHSVLSINDNHYIYKYNDDCVTS